MTLTRRVFAEKRRYIYPLAGALLLNAVLLVAVVLPLSRKVQGGEASAQQAAKALAAAKADYNAARATVTGKDAADAELKKFYGEILPVDQSEARRVVFKLQELAHKASLNAGRARTQPVGQQRLVDVDAPGHSRVRHLGGCEGARRLRGDEEPEPRGVGGGVDRRQLARVLEVGP